MKLLIDDLDKLIKKKKNKDGVNHERGSIEKILPFSSSKKTTIVKDRFYNVLGEFTREISGLALEDKKNEEEEQNAEKPLISHISEKVACEDDNDRTDLNMFLESYLFGQGDDIKSFHPYIFNYYPLSEKSAAKKEERQLAKFMYDVLIEKPGVFQDVFLNKEGEDILTTLVLDNLGNLQEKTNTTDRTYITLIKTISDLFREDFLFISKYRDYFLEHYPILVQYYYFLYLSQLALKFSEMESANYTKIQPLYFALDWESLNKRRSAADLGGYKTLKEKSKELFVHIHALSQLSHHTENMNKKRFYTYTDLKEVLRDHSMEQEFIKSINNWIKIYRDKANLQMDIKEAETLFEAFNQLFKCLQRGMSKETVHRYGESIEDAAMNKFLKQRGNLGYCLNLTQDVVLLFTAISVKDRRIPLKQLFEEYEKRGLKLDRYSKKEVVDLLDKLNIIEKKSDSGDAQYVKPIL